ncbi:hypothetical protein KKB55_02965, partial [Myxococcota bacterium]|nr:hypothetical protein [Myxococcota bacterium]MBU1896713.1 hypothetical protein [Myxococcota bacterium]
MRVPPLLTLTTALPRDPQDFSGRFIAELVLALRAEGLEGRVLAPAGRRLAGVEVVHFPTLGGVLDAGGAPDALERSPLRAGLSGLATSAAIAAALRLHRRPHEALVSHWLVPNGLIAPEAIHYAHGGDVALLERLIASRRLARRLDQRARAMIFVSEDLRRRFNACLARPPRAPQRVLPMGVSPHQPDLFALARIKAAARGRPIVATVGRLVPIKGLDVLIEALRGLPSARWVAAGEGPLREALAARARA